MLMGSNLGVKGEWQVALTAMCELCRPWWGQAEETTLHERGALGGYRRVDGRQWQEIWLQAGNHPDLSHRPPKTVPLSDSYLR